MLLDWARQGGMISLQCLHAPSRPPRWQIATSAYIQDFKNHANLGSQHQSLPRHCLLKQLGKDKKSHIPHNQQEPLVRATIGTPPFHRIWASPTRPPASMVTLMDRSPCQLS